MPTFQSGEDVSRQPGTPAVRDGGSMTDDDDDWAPPPVPHGDGDPIAAAGEALNEAETALRTYAWIPDADEVDAAAAILHQLDSGQHRPDAPARYLVHRALDETYPQLIAWRPRPLYLYAAVKTVQLLAAAPPTQERDDATLVAWDRLTVLLRVVSATAGGSS
ncbi:hypothetical protein ThrDRAFT_02748 [Frankia casuarinae]|uniref:Uncharacterized protein n=2 Tax=Frankiaceae TaxID=74712 RepID=Q2JAX1_FRACC|nr:hypothetical protein Francci3_2202 [Frankia casuarinae]ETA01169.1 hypothetical protein CcI6DRAFT_03414 [Frankia sp. CcI6]KDA41257.1 hypothetical protein BMG523Draft_03942 [Frankia sp. BMG5.23]KEZ34733.1 hypothetical protein CEDDRAFT_03893 [Frankia sp. CeD]KFB03711.1 hypothetical protein ALLO2DRAFT_03515 [Frankia sp. Allo2]